MRKELIHGLHKNPVKEACVNFNETFLRKNLFKTFRSVFKIKKFKINF